MCAHPSQETVQIDLGPTSKKSDVAKKQHTCELGADKLCTSFGGNSLIGLPQANESVCANSGSSGSELVFGFQLETNKKKARLRSRRPKKPFRFRCLFGFTLAMSASARVSRP
jgi:hypothetical protein